MKTFAKYLTIITITVVVLITGILIGQALEKHNQEVIAGKLQNSTKIAIVNLDEGVEYVGEHRNFSTEIIQNYSSDYVVTGLNDARTGVDDGRYSAYIILPSTFSSNVISINTQPVKTTLEYKISGNLSEVANDNAWMKVMEFEEQLNNDLGYIYLSSILTEFHGGQEAAITILENDVVDKEVLMAISNLDLVASLDLTEVERLQNNIQELSVSEDFEVNQAIINDIDLAYKGYLEQTSNQLTTLKTTSTQLGSDVNPIINATSSSTFLFDSEGNSQYTLSKTEDVLNTYLKKDSTNPTALKILGDEITNLEGTNNDLLDNKQSITTLLGQLSTLVNDYETQQVNRYEAHIVTIFQPQLNGAFDLSSYPEMESALDSYQTSITIQENEALLNQLILLEVFDLANMYGLMDTPFGKALVQNLENDPAIKNQLDIVAKDNDQNGYTINTYVDFVQTRPPSTTPILKDEVSTALNTDVNTKISEFVLPTCMSDDPCVEKSEIDVKISNISTAVSNLPTVDATTMQASYDATIDELNQLFTNLPTHIQTDMKVYDSTLVKNNDGIVAILNTFKTNHDRFNGQLTVYDPIANINAEEIQEKVDDLSDNNKSIENEFDDKNREYEQFVADSYSNADEYIHTMKQDIFDYQQKSDEQLTNGLEQAKTNKEETSFENSVLMNSFINTLPYTKNGTIGDTVVYDFITAPSNMDGNKALSTNVATTVEYNQYLYIICTILIGSVVVSTGINKYKNAKEKVGGK